MAKTKISEYDATAANNTDIDGINIAESCAPSGINNAIRELMAHLKDMDAGTQALTSPAFATASFTGDLTFGDNDKAIFGAGSDLQIYHDGSHSYIEDSGTGNLRIDAQSFQIRKQGTTENMAGFAADGAVSLYHDNSKKFETTSSGITVTGNIANASGDFTLDVAGDIILDADGAQLRFKDAGTEIGVISNSSNDLQIVSSVSDADMIFRGNDAGTPFNALTLDMSDAGSAYFNNKVGIGTSSPNTQLELHGTTPFIRLQDDQASVGTGANMGGIEFRTADSTVTGASRVTAKIRVESDATFNASDKSPSNMIFSTHGTSGTDPVDRVIIDSSGNLLVGQTSQSTSSTGFSARADSLSHFCRDTSTTDAGVLLLNKKTGDGHVLVIQKDDSTVGTIGAISGDIAIFSTATSHSGLRFGNKQILPTNHSGTISDNDTDLGDVSFRFDDIYATNGTIQTSDENEKQNIASLTSAEITAATAISKLFKTFKWKDKVAAKGDNARTHTGVVAQQVQTAMSDAGLDASKYAFWCSNTWWTKDNDHYDTKDEAPEGATEHTRMGVRYPELLAFIGAATEQRLTNIETRLAALEG